MVGNDFKRDIILRTDTIALASTHFLGCFDDWHEQIGFKNRGCALNNRHQSLQTHASINVLMRLFHKSAIWQMIQLRKDDVPDFDITRIFATRIIFWIIFSHIIELLATIIENFGIGTRRTFTDIPEIVFRLHNMIVRHPSFLPKFFRDLIFWIDGDV